MAPEAMTDEVWDAVFLGVELPAAAASAFPADLLDEMKCEFNFWYPVGLCKMNPVVSHMVALESDWFHSTSEPMK